MYVLITHLALSSCAVLSEMEIPDSELQHRRLAHINSCNMSQVHKFVGDVPKWPMLSGPCRAQETGKAHNLPCPGRFEKSCNVRNRAF